jgi:ribosomal protein S18 acetylase RimI-like enzyme
MTPPVRVLTAADAAAFRDIRLAGLADDPRAFSADWGAESVQPLGWFAARIASSEIFAVDGAAGHLLGITGLSIPQNPKQQHRGHIWGVYVRPEARGAGIATALLAAAIGAARGEVEMLHLGVGTYNDSARRRYRAAGFVETGFEARALRIGDEFIDEVTMTLTLA